MNHLKPTRHKMNNLKVPQKSWNEQPEVNAEYKHDMKKTKAKYEINPTKQTKLKRNMYGHLCMFLVIHSDICLFLGWHLGFVWRASRTGLRLPFTARAHFYGPWGCRRSPCTWKDPADPILKKINPDQSWSIILNLIFFNRKSCFFQSWGLILFSISDRYQINILNQYQTNPKIDTWSISALLLCELAENHVLRCRLAVNSL